jgi:hypothetical protein
VKRTEVRAPPGLRVRASDCPLRPLLSADVRWIRGIVDLGFGARQPRGLDFVGAGNVEPDRLRDFFGGGDCGGFSFSQGFLVFFVVFGWRVQKIAASISSISPRQFRIPGGADFYQRIALRAGQSYGIELSIAARVAMASTRALVLDSYAQLPDE